MVVGMHRSGTSATAGLLHRLGIHMGQELMPATPFNPKGYFEHLQVRDFNDRLLEARGQTWDSIFPLKPEYEVV